MSVRTVHILAKDSSYSCVLLADVAWADVINIFNFIFTFCFTIEHSLRRSVCFRFTCFPAILLLSVVCTGGDDLAA